MNDIIELDYKMLKNIIHVGYFRLENNFNALPVNMKQKITVHDFILNKKSRMIHVKDLLPVITFSAGIIVLLLSLVMYIFDYNTIGHVNYSHQGNYLGHNSLNWLHMLIIGLFLIVASIYFRYLRKLDKQLRLNR